MQKPASRQNDINSFVFPRLKDGIRLELMLPELISNLEVTSALVRVTSVIVLFLKLELAIHTNAGAV
jgi:hypothetical protein